MLGSATKIDGAFGRPFSSTVSGVSTTINGKSSFALGPKSQEPKSEGNLGTGMPGCHNARTPSDPSSSSASEDTPTGRSGSLPGAKRRVFSESKEDRLEEILDRTGATIRLSGG